jgi:hypothetical protein
MSIDAGRIANYPQNMAASRDLADYWLSRLRVAAVHEAGGLPEAVLGVADSLLATTNRNALAGALIAALLRIDEVEAELAKTLDNWDVMSEMRAERNHLAWRHARQRAADHLAALVESDTERDHLAVQLRERDEDVRDLANRLAEFCGITS